MSDFDDVFTFKTKLEIHIHQQNEASIFFENNCSDPIFGELVTFCLVTFRQAVNIGRPDIVVSLSTLLSSFNNLHSFREFAQQDIPEGMKLVPYAGYPGRKRFLGEIEMPKGRFKWKAKGFGFFGDGGLAFYAPSSVLLLLQFFARQHEDNPKLMKKLLVASKICGYYLYNNRVSIKNQTYLALQSATFVYQTNQTDFANLLLPSI